MALFFFGGGEAVEHKICVFIFLFKFWSETFLNNRLIEQDIIKKIFRSSCTVPLLLSEFTATWIFSTYFRKTLKCRRHCCTVLHIVVPCCMLLYRAAYCCTVLHIVVPCCMLLYRAACCCTVLHVVVPCCILLYRAACCFSIFFIVPTHALHYTLKH
jgi:hypothetical protein